MLEEETKFGVVGSSRRQPSRGFGVGNRLAFGLIDRAIPLNVDAHTDDRWVAAIPVEHQVDELFDRGVPRLDLEPNPDPCAVEEMHCSLIAVLLGYLDQRARRLRREVE